MKALFYECFECEGCVSWVSCYLLKSLNIAGYYLIVDPVKSFH